MQNADWLFATLAINPIGGLVIAIPVAIFKLGYPLWLAVLAGVPLSYVQVILIDSGWDQLNRMAWWRRFLESQRSPRIEKLMASGGSFWSTMLLAPLVGPWIVMAFMRYAQIPQRRVALPILLGMTVMASLIAGLCFFAPEVVEQWKNA